MTEPWPALPITEWEDTFDTLHMYAQIVGKVRLALSPMMNHWWQVPLYLTPRGLTTSPIPYRGGTFLIDFDVFDHALVVQTCQGDTRVLPLGGAVRDFYAHTMHALDSLGIEVTIWTTPVEVVDPIPFEKDDTHATYNPEHAHRYWTILRDVDTVLKEFRARFTGKSSQVHFFWGAFDLAHTRFSGRPAPPRPDADAITRFAYNAEQTSVGIWPGGTWMDGTHVDGPQFFAYAFPEPDGYRASAIAPAAARFDSTLGEFVLDYADVRTASDPRQMILDFAQSTYEAGARLQGWPLADLELQT